MNKKLITLEKLNDIVSDISAAYQTIPFQIFTGGDEDSLWVQVGTERPCEYTGEIGIGKGGKNKVSKYATLDILPSLKQRGF